MQAAYWLAKMKGVACVLLLIGKPGAMPSLIAGEKRCRQNDRNACESWLPASRAGRAPEQPLAVICEDEATYERVGSSDVRLRVYISIRFECRAITTGRRAFFSEMT